MKNEPPSLDHGDEVVGKGENQRGLRTTEEWDRLRRIELERGDSPEMKEQSSTTMSGQSFDRSAATLEQIYYGRQQAVDIASSEGSPNSNE